MADAEMKADAPAADSGASTAAAAPLRLAELVFQYGLPDDIVPDKAALAGQILEHVERNHMAAMYEPVCAKLGRPVDGALLERLRAKNAADVAGLDAKVVEAREKFGETEVFDALRDKADYYARVGDKASALKAYDELPTKGLSTGQRIDIVMAKARMAFAAEEWPLAKGLLSTARELNEKGGDWDRRNRLKVYEALLALVERDYARASGSLLDSIATFTASELCGYPAFIFYTVLAALKAVDRPALKKKVIDSPDVLSAIGDVPHLAGVLNAFYEGRYRDLFAGLTALYPSVARDRYLARHAPHWLREMRLRAYVQFLESYKSVTLVGMAAAFGVTPPFLDAELSRFIAGGRLNAKLDAVAGIIETTRPDTKNAQYAAVLKQGDALLNKVQKLSRVVTL